MKQRMHKGQAKETQAPQLEDSYACEGSPEASSRGHPTSGNLGGRKSRTRTTVSTSPAPRTWPSSWDTTLEASLTSRMTSTRTGMCDPGDQIIIHHIRAMHQLIQAWPPDQLPQLQQAWQATHHSLQVKQYPWYTVKGPMAATIAYLMEWGWDVQDLLHWTRPETDLMLPAEAHMTRIHGGNLNILFTKEAHQQRTNSFARRPNHQRLLTGLDWHTYKQLKTQAARAAAATPRHMGSGSTPLQRCQGHQTLSPLSRSGDTKACAMAVQMAQQPSNMNHYHQNG